MPFREKKTDEWRKFRAFCLWAKSQKLRQRLGEG